MTWLPFALVFPLIVAKGVLFVLVMRVITDPRLR